MNREQIIALANKVRPLSHLAEVRRSNTLHAWVVTDMWVLMLVCDDGTVKDLTHASMR
jgi:hypothetical protein